MDDLNNNMDNDGMNNDAPAKVDKHTVRHMSNLLGICMVAAPLLSVLLVVVLMMYSSNDYGWYYVVLTVILVYGCMGVPPLIAFAQDLPPGSARMAEGVFLHNTSHKILLTLLFYQIYMLVISFSIWITGHGDLYFTSAPMGNPGTVFMAVLFIGVVIPIVEEFIFRRVVLVAFAKHSRLLALVASTIVFSLVHEERFMNGFVLGLGGGFMYIGTNQLIWPVLMHILVNCTSFAPTLIMLPVCFVGSVFCLALLKRSSIGWAISGEGARSLLPPASRVWQDVKQVLLCPGMLVYIGYLALKAAYNWVIKLP